MQIPSKMKTIFKKRKTLPESYDQEFRPQSSTWIPTKPYMKAKDAQE
jgi:hypothetical protein